MMPYEALTQEDKSIITDYISSYAHSHSEATCAKPKEISTILTPWNENKQFLFKAFGNKLILQKEINFPMPEEEIIQLLRKQLMSYTNPFYKAYMQLDLPIYLITGDSLLHNKIALSQDFNLPNGKKIKNGEKLMRALSKIATAYNLPNFEEFRLQHSRILNKSTLNGTYCLSIHPIDYMTMSDSNYDWTSCMSWQNIGDYRQGTVEMMNSPYVVVGYLKGNHNNENFNSKRWRSLFIASDECIINIKGYPYQDNSLSRFGVEWLSSLLNLPVENITSYNDDIEFFIEEGYMYNDFCDHSIKRFINVVKPFSSLNFGGVSECMYCGNTYISNSIDLLCDDCEEKFYCEGCGERIIGEDTICYNKDGEPYHENCYCESYCEDALTGKEIRISDSARIYLMPSIANFKKIASLTNGTTLFYHYLSHFETIYTTRDNLSKFNNLYSYGNDYITEDITYFTEEAKKEKEIIKCLLNRCQRFFTQRDINICNQVLEVIDND